MQTADALLSGTQIAKLYALPSDFPEILAAAADNLRERHLRFLQKHAPLLERLQVASPLQDLSASPQALFCLTHSSFEYLTSNLARRKKRKDKEQIFLENSIRSLVADAALDFPREQGIYEVNDKIHSIDAFPNPATYHLTRDEKERECRGLIESAGRFIAEWDPLFFLETRVFVRNYALAYAEDFPVHYLSSEEEPGFVLIAPRRLLFKEKMIYPRGGKIEKLLVAAQIVHESRHQKGAFFNRFCDPRPVLTPSGFVKPGFRRTALKHPFSHFILANAFDLILSVGYEVLFLQSITAREDLGEYRECFENKIKRKKVYIFSILMAVEQNREALTPLGLQTLEAMMESFNQAPGAARSSL